MKNLIVEIQMATEGLEEKNMRRPQKEKKIVEKIRSIQEAQYMTKKNSTEREQRNPSGRNHW